MQTTIAGIVCCWTTGKLAFVCRVSAIRCYAAISAKRITRRQAALRTDHPQRGNRFEALRGMRQHVCGGQQPGEILPRLRGKDTPQTESPKREKQAFTDKNNYIASTANEYPFARNARASHRERGHFACWDSPKPLYDRERT